MESFEKILEDYFKRPFRPEYLYKKVKNVLNGCNYELIKKTEIAVIEENYYNYFQPIFGSNEKDFQFDEKATVAKSIGNFKNLIYEYCKLDNFNTIDKKVIVSYLFLLDNFKERIINAIYKTVLSQKKVIIFEDLFNNFLSNIYRSLRSTRQLFDEKYFNKWMEPTLNDKTIAEENKINDDEFSSSKMKINFEKFKYYGPDETTFNYVLNQKDNIPKDKVVLYTPDYLIEKKILNEYNNDDFQIFNSDNTCPDLFVYALKEAIKELNKKLNGGNVDEKIVGDIGITHFKDLFNGIYLNMTNPSRYYEIKNVIEELKIKKQENDLNVVIFSSSTATKMKTIAEDEKLSEMQDFYMQYNAHVNEEQLSHTLVDYIENEIKNEVIEILPRIIFYFNLYILDNSEKKQRIVFTAKEKGYGFEEVDGLFYLESQDIILNKFSDIPFFKIMRFNINKNNDELPVYVSNEENSKILIQKESLIYMEVKNSFPLKLIQKNQEKIIQGFDEANSLIRSIMRKTNKFTELALNRGKKIQNIHVLFMYDSLLQKNEDFKYYVDNFKKIFETNRFKVGINTTFDVIYFVNPSSINTRRLSEIISELKEENKKSAETIKKTINNNTEEIKKISEDYNSKLEEMKKNNEEERRKMSEDYNSKLEEIKKNNKEEREKMRKNNEEEREKMRKNNEEEREKMRADYNSKLEEINKNNKEEREKMKNDYNSKLEQIMKINENLSKKIKELETKINNSEQNKQNTNEIIELNINNNSNDLMNSNFLMINDELMNIFEQINIIMKNNNDNIDNIQVSNEGTIYLLCINGLYIINQNLFEFIPGYRKVVLPLNNGDLLTSKNMKIIIYSNNNFENETKTIDMKCYVKQIILLPDENKFLFLSE